MEEIIPDVIGKSWVIAGQTQVKEPVRYLALGDSYTIGASVSYDDRWPSQLYYSLGELGIEQDTLVYIATTGWTTSNLKNAIASSDLENDFNLVSLLIGVNNQYQSRPFELYEKEFPELISTAIEFVNGDTNQLFVVSIPDYAFTPFGNGNETISTELDDYNDFANKYCDSLGIKFYYITDISRRGLEETNLVAYDNLHPSGLQYKLWVDLIVSDFSNEVIANLNEEVEEEFGLYPNPTNQSLTIIGDFDQYEIMNFEGVIVQKGENNGIIDVSSLQEGIYFIRINDTIKRFVVY